jgi:two-component system, cell cycle sensor histidine kinase and response regulator CckA
LTYACLEVTDTGCGIAVENIEKLFDPFFSSKFTGRGLGLPVVLGIIKAHGGAVTVESKVRRGSTFRVFLPLSAEEVPLQPDKKAKHSLVFKEGGVVLLVEDEEMARNMTETMLTRLGFKVLLAKDGVEAVTMFRNHLEKISVVLCDLSMPNMNGWETLSALRQIRPDIQIILGSVHDESKVTTCDHPDLPYQVFLHKPYQKTALKVALERAMAAHRSDHEDTEETSAETIAEVKKQTNSLAEKNKGFS